MQASKGDRYVGIDAMRGLGALMVLLWHGFWGHIDHEYRGGLVYWVAYPWLQGAVGVNLFLVVSGFCIHVRTAARDPNTSPDFIAFWGRRIRRLYPPFLMAALLGLAVRAAALYILNPGVSIPPSLLFVTLFPGGVWDFAKTSLELVLMLFAFFPRTLIVFGNDVFWTLGLEEQLYMLYFLVLSLRRRLGVERMVWLVLGITLAWRAAVFFLTPEHANISFAAIEYVFGHRVDSFPEIVPALIQCGPARWFEWVLGSLAAEVVLQKAVRRRWYTDGRIGWAAVVLALACQWSRLGWVLTDPLWGIGFFVLINILLEREARGQVWWWIRPLAVVGLFSYSLYLVHYPLCHMLAYLLQPYLSPLPCLAVATALTIPPSYLLYRLVEVPSIAWSRRSRPPT